MLTLWKHWGCWWRGGLTVPAKPEPCIAIQERVGPRQHGLNPSSFNVIEGLEGVCPEGACTHLYTSTGGRKYFCGQFWLRHANETISLDHWKSPTKANTMPHKCVWLQDESHGILQPTLLSLAISALKLSLLFLRYIYPPTRSLPCKRGGAWEILNHVRKCRCGERIWTVIIRHLYMDESKKLFHVLAGERWGETYWKRICQMIKRWNSDIGRDIQTHTHTHTYIQLHTHIPWWLSSKESTSNARVAGGAGSIPESERSPGGGHSNPLQYSCLENPMDRGAWWATVHMVAKKQLSMHTHVIFIIYDLYILYTYLNFLLFHILCISYNGHAALYLE